MKKIFYSESEALLEIQKIENPSIELKSELDDNGDIFYIVEE